MRELRGESVDHLRASPTFAQTLRPPAILLATHATTRACARAINRRRGCATLHCKRPPWFELLPLRCVGPVAVSHHPSLAFVRVWPFGGKEGLELSPEGVALTRAMSRLLVFFWGCFGLRRRVRGKATQDRGREREMEERNERLGSSLYRLYGPLQEWEGTRSAAGMSVAAVATAECQRP